MKAKEYLQEKYPQLRGKNWNSHSVINDDWVAEMMEAYAKDQIEKAFEAGYREANSEAIKEIWDHYEPKQ